ncbi:TPA: transglycosylase SLT domain-containing protein [Klebsiella oxytoca]|uniref:transglycosylase SLT domain-containing protein n=1 Tax=Klebsiella oxytoca TaxID=571 RepID=UPI0013D141CD|nr:transglycosylase SLT domain-containing protein [Klebsiella oxytoca]ELA2786283.1 transglycosylase SLT domain-containing protein [Klebsiella pneumoniae]EJY1763157.1 transglycosylase SLT domain-containing protein [Klebsiella oxytoca]MDZ7496249.1 transglycosylase SLT domain-containing protein [Klebsiella oxytoca]NKX97703.1 transglycosylase SLT domain-containing protein [Klebsiella oxytoca]WOZ95616.1 transglycosylase SLT domain-containing protein [Klebsiella pneumoniae]
MIRLALSLILLCLLSGCHPALAASIPVEARQYQRELTRNARAVWGLNAPVSTFAAQIHQESQWNARARSPVGAQGLAQFMPATASWIAGIYPDQLKDHQPYNPSWAMRALVQYNRWHWQRITGTASDCDRMAFALSAYNGGLGWVQKDRKLATSRGLDASRYWNQVEKVNAGRSAANFRENRGYPLKIIYTWQPRYLAAGWGPGECHDVD